MHNSFGSGLLDFQRLSQAVETQRRMVKRWILEYTPEEQETGFRHRLVTLRDSGWGAVRRPKYFYQDLSIHALLNVPAQPASHGCARVYDKAIDWLWDQGNVPVGTPVWVY